MRIVRGEVFTTTEILKDFFDMNQRLIYNMSEKLRYEYIYNHLVEHNAEEIIVRGENKYSVFKLKGEIYLIPKDIFDENDEDWLNQLNDNFSCK